MPPYCERHETWFTNCGEHGTVACLSCELERKQQHGQRDSEVSTRQAMRVEVLTDLLTLTDAGIELDSAALRELIAEVRAATESVRT